MLKLEKIAKTRELNVLLRSKPTILTFPFLCALGYALLVHIAALLIFQISPFKVNYQQSIFPPVKVATEIPIRHGVLSTNLQFKEQEPVADYLIAPLPSSPTLPKAYEMIPIASKEDMKPNHLFNSFLPLEEIFADEIKAQHMKESQNYKPMSIHLAGALAELSLIDRDVGAIDSQPQPTYRLLFAVKVNQANGEIFWWDIKDAPDSKKLQDDAINMLKNMQFIPQLSPDILSGEIEIVMTSESKG